MILIDRHSEMLYLAYTLHRLHKALDAEIQLEFMRDLKQTGAVNTPLRIAPERMPLTLAVITSITPKPYVVAVLER